MKKNMRLSGLLFCLSICLTMVAQEGPNGPNLEKVIEKVTGKFAPFIAAHPDQEAVTRLKKDTEAGSVDIALDKEQHEFLIANWQGMLMRLIASWAEQKSLAVPDNFFVLSSCQQKIAVESLGLAYGHLVGLPAEQARLLSDFSGSKDEPDDVDDKQQKGLLAIVDGFEKLATDNTDRFAEMMFTACPAAEIESLFKDYKSVADAKSWSEITKEKIKKQFGEFRSLILQ